MKALSVKQPYACAIAEGYKNIEFRSKPTSHRGELLICASKSERGYTTDDGKKLPVGCAMVIVNVIDCRRMTEADKSEYGAPQNIDGWWAWVLDPNTGETVEPKNVNGSISFFNVDDDLIVPIDEGKTWADFEYQH